MVHVRAITQNHSKSGQDHRLAVILEQRDVQCDVGENGNGLRRDANKSKVDDDRL